MTLPSRSEYAAIAVYELALVYQGNKPLSAQKIAEKYRLSANYLTQTLQQLRRANLVETIRGAQGGFRLLAKPEEITLGYVMALAEDASPTSKSCRQTELKKSDKLDSSFKSKQSRRSNRKNNRDDREIRNKLDVVWQKAEAKRQEYLNSILFSDLISNAPKEHILNFTI